MKNCCFCFNVRSGTIASAISNLVMKIVAIIVLAILYCVGRPVRGMRLISVHAESYVPEELVMYDAGFNSAIVYCIISLICCILLIVGVKKGNRGLFWPWLIITGLEILFGFVVICVFFILWNIWGRSIIVSVGILTIYQGYCFRCVAAHYREMNKETKSTKEMVVDFSYKQLNSDCQDQSSP